MEEKTIYYISEAAKKVQVESHVLRYWEEELKLPIKRNEMGHRYYTEQDVRQLQEIKLFNLFLFKYLPVLFLQIGKLGKIRQPYKLYGADRTISLLGCRYQKALMSGITGSWKRKTTV